MSRAIFAHESLSTQSLKASGSTLRVNRPGDAHEVEADYVAERITRGERVASWSLKSANPSGVQRDPQTTPDGHLPPARQLSAADMAGKAAEALLATKEGKAALVAIKKDPLVKSTTDFLATPAGIIVAGSAATAVITGLALEHKALPLQLPKIPLDFVHPGLSMKLSYHGPVDKPTTASLTLSYTPVGPKHKKTDASASIRDEIAQLRAQQQWIQGSMSEAERPGPTAQPAAAGAAKKAPATVPTPEAALKSAPKTQDSAKPHAEKRDEAVIQRKAETAEARAHTVPAATASVRDALHDSGRPLDARTRGYMESRFGVNFSNVRIHTGDRAAHSARSIQARAYTVGTDIVFASGKYAPETTSGRRLLAHELTHVVQQSPGTARKPAGISPSPARVQRAGGVSGWIADKVRSIPGYDLFCAIIGKDIATWTAKPSSIEDILREFLKLVHAEEVWERLSKAAGAIKKAWEWFKEELTARRLTLDDFKALIEQAKDSIHAGDLLDPEGAIERLKGMFRPSYEQAIDLGKLAAKKLFEIIVEFVMETFGDTGKQVMGYLRKAGETISTIAHDPIKFVGNLVSALKLGFKKFADRFLAHLQASLMDFLFGEVGSRITIPKSFSLSAIFNLVLEILELNYDKFRARLVEKTSPEAVTILEGAYDAVTKIAHAKSLSAAWDIIWQQAGTIVNTLIDTVIDKIKNWVMTAIVQKAIEKVLEMFTPASAVVAAIEAIYHTIVTLINKGKQLLDVLNATVDSIARIAAGDVDPAAEKIDGAMAKALNFLVAFFAEQAGVGGIGQTIRDIIKAIHDKVWGIIDKVIDYIVGKASGLLAKAKQTAGKVLAWWQQRRDLVVDDRECSIYVEGSENAPKLLIANSPGVPWSDYLKKREKSMSPKDKQKKGKLLEDTKAIAAKLEAPLEKSTDDKDKGNKVEAKRKLFASIADNIVALGFSEDDTLPASVIKYDEPRADGGGTKMTASVLSKNHPEGTAVADQPPIWTNLDKLQKQPGKTYIQGHLLNRNLGGEGRRFNLSPITNSANQTHLNDIEDTIKTMVNKKKGSKVVKYIVEAVYSEKDGGSKHPISSRYQTLLDIPKANLTDKQDKEKAMYDAEQRLCNRFEYDAWELKQNPDSGEWVDDKKIKSGKVLNNVAP
jgi:Domain of unknown function (DUF4157)/DNA/RNA non-specific endonuclease